MTDINLLLVDAVPSSIIALTNLIERTFQVNILTATNGFAALKIILQYKVDLILCDVEMSEMNGFELAATLKQKQSARDIPVLFMTAAFDHTEYAKLALDLGVIDYIAKPIDPNLLIARLKTYVQLFGMQKKLLANTTQLRELNASLEQKIYQRTSELQRSESRFREMFEHHDAVMLLLDLTTGVILDANPSASRFYGYALSELKTMSANELSYYQEPSFLHQQRNLLLTNTSFQMDQRIASGVMRSVEIYSSPINHGYEQILFWIIHDISERKLAEQQVHQLAFYDPLTNLPNRRLFEDRLSHARLKSKRMGSYTVLMLIDIDNFKTLNDSLGHDVGDMLLVEVAERLKSCVRNSDSLARLGGDEFIVLMEALGPDESQAIHKGQLVAEKIRASLAEPYMLQQHVYRTTPSIGVVLFQGDGDTEMELSKHANTAMYKAKTSGRNTYRFYNPEMQKELEQRAALEIDLRNAYDQQQFQLYYQIQVNNHGVAIGAEALLRWNHPVRGFVPPTQFIPLAEEIGLIGDIGLWVIQTACQQIKAWSANPVMPNLTISVNVSAHQFQQSDFVEQVKLAISESGIKAEQLRLELTESVFLYDAWNCIDTMHELKALGLSLSMDDFGTGYSSFSYLKLLPLDELKIDQSFVRDLGIDDNDAAIVKAIITLGGVFGLQVIAEGLENELQREFLHSHGCMHYQGYMFSKPLPVQDFVRLFEARDYCG